MDKKKHKLTQGQINGIIWIAILLVVILAIKLFSSNRVETTPETDSVQRQEQAFLDKKEDSAYHSRYKDHGNKRYQRKNTRQYASEEPQNWYTHEPPAPTRRPLTVDLNSADTTTLMLLNGIGPAFARRIVRYRDRLGGFYDKRQLLEINDFPAEALPYLTVSAPVRKLRINQLSLNELKRHPYINFYQARDIIEYRRQRGPLKNIRELRLLPDFTDTDLERLSHYLSYE